MNQPPLYLPRDTSFVPRQRFEALIARHIASALPTARQLRACGQEVTPEDTGEVPVELGVLYPMALLGPPGDDADSDECASSVVRTIPAGGSATRVVDRCGHARPVYRPLLVYSLTQTFALLAQNSARAESATWRAALQGWQMALTDRATELESRGWATTAARGADVAEAVWIELAVRALRDVCPPLDGADRADEVMDRLVGTQQPNGAFLRSSPSDNPEAAGYHELLILHAVASSAVLARDASLLDAVRRGALFHLAEMQPDHATNQPWALFAFLLDPLTFPFADGLITTAVTQLGEGGPSPIALMLMADALYCLRRVREP